MKIAFFGSSLLSSRWNGAATYYRGMIRALAALGYRTTFFEPDVYERQQHRDIDPPAWCDVVVYEPCADDLKRVAARAGDADIVVKASGVGFEDDAPGEIVRWPRCRRIEADLVEILPGCLQILNARLGLGLRLPEAAGKCDRGAGTSRQFLFRDPAEGGKCRNGEIDLAVECLPGIEAEAGAAIHRQGGRIELEPVDTDGLALHECHSGRE